MYRRSIWYGRLRNLIEQLSTRGVRYALSDLMPLSASSQKRTSCRASGYW